MSLQVTGDRETVRSFGIGRRHSALLGASERLVEPTCCQVQFAEPQAPIDEAAANEFNLAAQLVEAREIEEGVAAPQLDGAGETSDLHGRVSDSMCLIGLGDVSVQPCEVGIDEW